MSAALRDALAELVAAQDAIEAEADWPFKTRARLRKAFDAARAALASPTEGAAPVAHFEVKRGPVGNFLAGWRWEDGYFEGLAEGTYSLALASPTEGAAPAMTVIDLQDDDTLRYACRVLSHGSHPPEEDRARAKAMLMAIRTRLRAAQPAPPEGASRLTDELLTRLLHEQPVRDQSNASWDDENMFAFARAAALAIQGAGALKSTLSALTGPQAHKATT